MAFLGRLGRVRIEVVLGLLIVLGKILGGSSEGFKCYHSDGPELGASKDCEATDTACLKAWKDNIVVGRYCAPVNKKCWDEVYGAACVTRDTEKEKKYEDCSIAARNDTSGRTFSKLRQGHDQIVADSACICYKDLCNDDTLTRPTNPAGRSAPNKQVIYAILVAASLSTFGIGIMSPF